MRDNKMMTALMHAACQGSINSTKLLDEQGMRDVEGRTALIWAGISTQPLMIPLL